MESLHNHLYDTCTYFVHYYLNTPRTYIKQYLRRRRLCKSRKENPQKPTQIKPQISSKTSRGEKDGTKNDAVKDTNSDSQVNSHLSHRRPPASLTINTYFYLFSYLYITRITINNGTPYLKSFKSQRSTKTLVKRFI